MAAVTGAPEAARGMGARAHSRTLSISTVSTITADDDAAAGVTAADAAPCTPPEQQLRTVAPDSAERERRCGRTSLSDLAATAAPFIPANASIDTTVSPGGLARRHRRPFLEQASSLNASVSAPATPAPVGACWARLTLPVADYSHHALVTALREYGATDVRIDRAPTPTVGVSLTALRVGRRIVAAPQITSAIVLFPSSANAKAAARAIASGVVLRDVPGATLSVLSRNADAAASAGSTPPHLNASSDHCASRDSANTTLNASAFEATSSPSALAAIAASPASRALSALAAVAPASREQSFHAGSADVKVGTGAAEHHVPPLHAAALLSPQQQQQQQQQQQMHDDPCATPSSVGPGSATPAALSSRATPRTIGTAGATPTFVASSRTPETRPLGSGGRRFTQSNTLTPPGRLLSQRPFDIAALATPPRAADQQPLSQAMVDVSAALNEVVARLVSELGSPVEDDAHDDSRSLDAFVTTPRTPRGPGGNLGARVDRYVGHVCTALDSHVTPEQFDRVVAAVSYSVGPWCPHHAAAATALAVGLVGLMLSAPTGKAVRAGSLIGRLFSCGVFGGPQEDPFTLVVQLLSGDSANFAGTVSATTAMVRELHRPTLSPMMAAPTALRSATQLARGHLDPAVRRAAVALANELADVAGCAPAWRGARPPPGDEGSGSAWAPSPTVHSDAAASPDASGAFRTGSGDAKPARRRMGPGEAASLRQRTVYFAHVPGDVTVAALAEWLEQFGAFDRVRLTHVRGGAVSAFVEFANSVGATRAVAAGRGFGHHQNSTGGGSHSRGYAAPSGGMGTGGAPARTPVSDEDPRTDALFVGGGANGQRQCVLPCGFGVAHAHAAVGDVATVAVVPAQAAGSRRK